MDLAQCLNLGILGTTLSLWSLTNLELIIIGTTLKTSHMFIEFFSLILHSFFDKGHHPSEPRDMSKIVK